jgi:AbrB family looped-hinge helix DNA binding protein
MSKHQVWRLDAKSSAEGQVTIPVEIRQMIGLEPGGSVQLVTSENGEVRLIAKRKDISHLFGIFGPQDGPVDIEEAIMEAVWDKTKPLDPRGDR